jgi:hypothetical protein
VDAFPPPPASRFAVPPTGRLLLFFLFAAVILADVWLRNSPPYSFDSALGYSEWLDRQPALKWFWAGRPAWDFPVAGRILWLLLVLAALCLRGPVPMLERWIASARRPPTSLRRPVSLAWILLPAALFLWLFRSGDLRYGDSGFITHLIPDEVRYRGLYMDYQEIFDILLHCRGYYHLNRLLDWDIVTVFNVLGIAGALIALAVVWPRWRRQPGLPTGLVLLLWFSAGWSQVFFGHVEFYTSVAVVLLIYAVIAADHLEDRGYAPFWLCCALAAVSGGFHLLAGWMWPTLAVLAWKEIRTRGKSPVAIYSLAAGIFLVVAAIAVALATAYGFPISEVKETHLARGKFIFLLTPENADARNALYHYAFLSPRHLTDVANECLRTAWPGLVLVIGLAPTAWRRGWLRKPTVVFWIIAATAFQVFALTWNSDLGYHRDWDLFAVVGLGWTGLGLELLRQAMRDEHAPPPPDLVPLLLFVLLTAVPMRLMQVLHHSWLVTEPNLPGMF